MCTLDTPQTPVGDDSMEVPESEEGTPAPSEGSRSGKKARGGKKSVAPLKIKLNKRKKKKTSSVSSCLFVDVFSIAHNVEFLYDCRHRKDVQPNLAI